MLEQAKVYEVKAMQIQNEINEHKNRLIRENQEMLSLNMAQKDEFKRKLKKKEAKVEKYKAQYKQLSKENSELKLKSDDLQQKM